MKQLLTDLKEILRDLNNRKSERKQLHRLLNQGFDYQYLLNLIKLSNLEDKNVLITLKDGTSISIFDKEYSITNRQGAIDLQTWNAPPSRK